ncbi:secretogranin-1 isoform X2 [Colius striatus]|uniref:secretogranin-1 isoform X2 n=1 Tax=Colius striatus TaxID=57412 RepID=UPI002B1E0664|nr:secretogranin-1 isoform X2 [Colius striatus]
MGPLALLGLLGAAALAGVSAVPVEKDNIEEMVTRCIVEVLSNALSKPNAPPINPECKEILKKSGRNDRERSEDKQLEVRHLKDPAEVEKHHSGSVEKEQSQAEEESKYMKGSDEGKLAHEEGKSKDGEDGQHTPMQEERLHAEEKKYSQEIRKEEKSYHSEEESKESKRHDEEVEHAVLNKKSHSGGTSTEELPDGKDQPLVRHWHSEEGMQSPYKRIHEEGEAEEEGSEKYYHESKERDFSHQEEHEESDESEEIGREKQPYKLKRYHGKHRTGDSSEEKRGRGGEKEELAEESHAEEARLWDKRNHHQKHHEESEQQRDEKSGYHGRHGSEEVEEKRRAEQGNEYRERWQQSKESSEEENERHRHSEESDEKWLEERRHRDGSDEVRRHRDGSDEVRRHRSEGRMYLGGESEEEGDGYLGGGSRERQHRAGGRYNLWDNEEEGSQKAYARERKGQARRHYSTEESVEHQRYPGNSEEEEEEDVEKHHSSHQMENEEENIEEGRYAEREEYRSRLPVENEKRTPVSYSSFYPLLWWKSQNFEKRDSTGEQLLEGKEKSLFPDYNDYDWWDKNQILSALNHGRTEKRNLGKMNRYDVKRQYNKMDQLAQLLNYRKKSAEFPELYNSGEDMKKRHVTRNDRRSQRPLTEEEEKELENLAAMDLELQKIAEKFNANRRG